MPGLKSQYRLEAGRWQRHCLRDAGIPSLSLTLWTFHFLRIKLREQIPPSFLNFTAWDWLPISESSLAAMTGYFSFTSKFDALNWCPFRIYDDVELSIFI